MTAKGWRQREPLDDIILKQEPILQRKSIDILLQNNIFNAQGFLDELAANGLSMKPEDVEALLNLDKGTLSMQEKKSSASIVKIK